MTPTETTRLVAAAAIAAVAVAAGLTWRDEVALRAHVADHERAVAALQQRVDELESRQGGAEVDWSAIAAAVKPSVVTIDAGSAVGSGWVAHSGTGGSEVVTNFHVVAATWTAGNAGVKVRRQDRILTGTIVRVDRGDDLAVIHVAQRLPALRAVEERPRIGAMVLAVGSPLGLDGTVAAGVVSGYRSLEGADYLQFSAPISPGNSGGPVVDARGHVVAIASAKLVGAGIEGLALGIPVQVACAGLVACERA